MIQKKILKHRALHTLATIWLLCLNNITYTSLTRLSSSDPHPMYTTLDPQNFLYTREKLKMIGVPIEVEQNQRIGISFSPFSQTACVARNQQNNTIPLGDINGRWNMIALLFGPTPNGQILPPSLQCAANQLFTKSPPSPIVSGIICPPKDPLDDGCSSNPTCPLSQYIDPAQNFGNFSVPLTYKKRGLRLQFQAILGRLGGGCDMTSRSYKDYRTYDPCKTSSYQSHFGIEINAGVSDIAQYLSQTCQREIILNNSDTETSCCRVKTTCGTCYLLMPGFHNRTCCTMPDGCPPLNGICNQIKEDSEIGFTKEHINTYLMSQLKIISDEIGLDIAKFHRVSPEDINVNFFWRHAYFVNKGRTGWPAFLAMPYLEAGGVIAIGHRQDPNKAFALPFGNNGHHALGGVAGLDLDFINSVTFGAEVGSTYFFKRKVCDFRVPNSIYQSGIYPFTTNVTISPGFNWHFAGKMSAYHFIDRLSFYFQYIYVHHETDSIKLCCPNAAFLPEKLEETSCWTSQMANIGFAYDISPNITLGFLWQTPTVQHHAFRSTTLMFTFNAEF